MLEVPLSQCLGPFHHQTDRPGEDVAHIQRGADPQSDDSCHQGKDENPGLAEAASHAIFAYREPDQTKLLLLESDRGDEFQDFPRLTGARWPEDLTDLEKIIVRQDDLARIDDCCVGNILAIFRLLHQHVQGQFIPLQQRRGGAFRQVLD